MYYVVETPKSFEQASQDLEAAVKAHQFGVLHIHDLGQTLRTKGFDFKGQCRVFEVCNPGQASKVLAVDMNLNMALPCRISVFTEQGVTKIGMIRPEPMLAMLSDNAELVKIAQQVESATQKMIDQAK
ncbi:MAG: DUF302 domain-containing protein [Thiomicrospira sp.]|uniref:DUF302 domain-containing protein n=1 Tax=Thiomicrospira sp. TaxID=935 RepID=UPI0019E0DF63|nr:DUF302 domain-containing protein [Thiomicrospira sp.]MBE0492766.1 DUF302 domain-containing protein [Thiomicrospira sp.]